ncbi:peptidoglycan DD-metalloendopeptidase family protein [Cytobacillus firmus]|uniref:peptidoglycan DD-metalloendopeptidase family protein n=1 Tax=Cytobacillus firmus TaxID=1399 RepID=UPI0021C72ECE|nr:peptidoglycan DD-metalloendopeptidase family protein [Cytobacillus firmus]MCU1808150.1 peptidoglycan DD-metalloendopeptidase family protein [Cytobacillus firmus]
MLPSPQEREREPSVLRKYAEHKAKQQGRKVAKKLAKKGAKFAVKLAKFAAKKFVLILGKVLAWLVGAVGLPVIGIALAVIVALIVISLAWSFMFGTGDGLEGEDKKIHEYIVQQANGTVNMNSSLERPYRVPEKLIAATIQLDAFQKNDDIKGVIRKMANSLAPTFDYGQYDEWKEKQVTVCEDGKCKTGPVKRTSNMVTKLNHVEYWNGTTTFTYTPKVTPWKTTEKITYREEKYKEKVKETYTVTVVEYYIEYETRPYTVTEYVPYEEKIAVVKLDENDRRYVEYITVTKYKKVTRTEYKKVTVKKTKSREEERVREVEVEKVRKIEVKTITKTRQQYFESSKSTITDYATLDSILNSYGLGLTDKSIVEVNYMFMGGTIAYTDWLQTMGTGGSFGGSPGFDGTIIPGAGVPPQYMPFYRSAEKKYGVDWYVLAAVHFVETGFSSHKTMVSSVGAVGHMQFMPATWVGWKYNIGGGLVSSSLDITSPALIAAGNGYGRDAQNDGKADPWDMEDAIHTAAYYLSKNGYAKDARKAIWQYNHADWYVNKVLSNAEKFKTAATYEGGGDTPPLKPGSFMRPAIGPVSSPFGARWGTVHYGTDIASGGKSKVPIVASADGTVSRSYFSSSYGNVVFIKHNINGQAYETIYAHMTNRAVSQGAKVKQGQFLGYMGTTGNSTGVHLHFEVHKNQWTPNKGNAMNPALVVQF